MYNVNIKKRPIYTAFCYISMAYITGATLWALWVSKFLAFAIIPVSVLLVYMVFLYSEHVFPLKMLRNMVWRNQKVEMRDQKNKNLENYFFLSIFLSVTINSILNPYELNAQLVCFYYSTLCFIWGSLPLFNDITYTTRVNASSTFFKKNTAKRELILKTLILIPFFWFLLKLSGFIISLHTLGKIYDEVFIILGWMGLIYIISMGIANLLSAYYVMIFKKELFKEIIKEHIGK